MKGAWLGGWGPSRRYDLESFIRQQDPEYPTFSTCEIWAEIRSHTQRLGRRMESEDAWVAASAIYLDLPLVTHNARHYEHVPGLTLLTSADGPR